MKLKSLVFALILCASLPVSAATLAIQWDDPTPKGAAYSPAYYVEYTITDPATAVVKSTAVVKANETNISATIPASAGDVVQARIRASNVVVPTYPVAGQWSDWYTASPVTAPASQTPIFTVLAY